MVNFGKGMSSFASRASRVMESQVRKAEGIEVQEEGIEDEMKRNLQATQAAHEKLLNGFMEASQDRFSKLEKSINKIKGHMGRIADRVLNREFGSSKDSLNLGSVRAILRSERIVNNGRNEEVTDESNTSPRKRNDEVKRIPDREDIEDGRIQILDEVEASKMNPINNKPSSPSVPKVPYPRRLRKDKMEPSFKDIYDVLSKPIQLEHMIVIVWTSLMV
ncbi:hypothetical protein Q3G72_032997 [Acer saccharum]|nr:hypothetical protein Q3G72_032997 [Acer saccharum]